MSVVVFTPDVVGRRMAGPGIRAWHFARELAKHFPTTLIAQLEHFVPAGDRVLAVDRRSADARATLQKAHVVIGQPTRELLALNPRRQKLVFDLFDPVVLELRELYGARPSIRERIHLQREWGRLHAALRRGSLLIAATPRQRDFYTGVWSAAIRRTAGVPPAFIDIPFGIDEDPPTGSPALPTDPPLIVWGGGTWEWLDPETAIAAVRDLNRRGVACRLLFLGGARPNRELPRLGAPDQLRRLAGDAGDQVIMNEQWVPYDERARWLLSAKVAIMLHRRTLEAEFSIRTRLFDAIWCSLPIVATSGGFAAELVGSDGLGVVVEPSNIPAVSRGIETLLRDDAFYTRSVSNLTRIRERYLWSEVIRPLVRAVERWV